ncbi:MAG: hypothetical protein K6C69_02650 [Lachnospiraceae bacterium]|nr:hypothetical protein [Lachnospiraceae bacterium]
MKCRRTPIIGDAERYELGKGLEDGFELWTDIITKGWIVTTNLIKVQREDGTIVCPYITHRRGRTFIGDGDYIIIEDDGTKHVVGQDKFPLRFEIVEE